VVRLQRVGDKSYTGQNGGMSEATTVTLADGVELPLVGFGTWQVSGRRGYDAIRLALEAGYRHIDTATMYANETEVGQAVRDSGIPREDVFITTKLPPERAGRARDTIAASLRALKMSYVDLWLIHWPPRGRASVGAWQDFITARDGGLVRSIGVSNYSTTQIDELAKETGVTPTVNQIPWSPWEHNPTRLEELRQRGVVLEGYSPFKRSDLSDRTLADIAAAHDVTPAQVVLRWHLQHGIVVIPKSVKPERIRTNFDVFGFALSGDEMARMDRIA
jgi:2,5-diketo-D-gluconate reductase A